MHVCRVIHFKPDVSKEVIQKFCYDWQQAHADPGECGYDGPMDEITWTTRFFSTKAEADEYLEDTFGYYEQTAVQYKDDNGQVCWAVACEVHC